MKHLIFALATIAGATLAPIIAVSAQETGDLGITSFIVDGGGCASSGGDFTLGSSVGQPDVSLRSGGDCAMAAGFWSSLTATVPAGPLVLHASVVDGALVLAWPAAGNTEVVLEESQVIVTSPTEAAWTPVQEPAQTVADELQVRLPLTPTCRFYRLHRP